MNYKPLKLIKVFSSIWQNNKVQTWLMCKRKHCGEGFSTLGLSTKLLRPQNVQKLLSKRKHSGKGFLSWGLRSHHLGLFITHDSWDLKCPKAFYRVLYIFNFESWLVCQTFVKTQKLLRFKFQMPFCCPVLRSMMSRAIQLT